MRKALVIAAFATLAGLGTAPATAQIRPVQVTAPDPVEPVACVLRRERVVRPNGAVVFRTARRCGPGSGGFARPGCRVVRERVERPNGAVVFRSIRRCG